MIQGSAGRGQKRIESSQVNICMMQGSAGRGQKRIGS